MGIMVQYGPITKHYAKGLTNRRCLLIFGFLLAAAGIAGFFVDSRPGDLYHLNLGQSILYLVLGLASLYVGEVWNSEYKQVFLGIEGVFFFGIGVAGFIISALAANPTGPGLWLFSINQPWENMAHLLLGLVFLGASLYPRRFRDYSYGPNVSD